MISKKLPSEIYVRVDDNSDGTTFLNAEDNLIELAELGESHEVGVYKLVKRVKVSGVTEIQEIKKRK